MRDEPCVAQGGTRGVAFLQVDISSLVSPNAEIFGWPVNEHKIRVGLGSGFYY